MKLASMTIHVSTKGNGAVHDLTDEVQERLEASNLNSGFINLFIAGATGALTTIEYEPGLVEDLQHTLKRIAPDDLPYMHNRTKKDGNAHSHLHASLIGPCLCVPFENGKLMLGRWQQTVLVDCDTRPREREILVQIIGE
jgi:secondary thiamine-phosphate synthase enzyme